MPNQSTTIKNFNEIESDFIINNRERILNTFKNAINRFIVREKEYIKMLASSLDWFQEEWGRDSFISLEGIFLVDKRYDDAKIFLRKWVRYERSGLLPRTLKEPIRWADGDTPLWFIRSIKRYYEYTHDISFILEVKHVIKDILLRYIYGISYEDDHKIKRIYMDDDNLIYVDERATWMDASALGKLPPITPRNGKPIEINSLFYESLIFAKYLEDTLNVSFDIDIEYYISQMRRSIRRKFWDPIKGYVMDVIDGDKKGDALRPNMLFGLRIENLFTYDILESSLDHINKFLLTPAGLRTLSPEDEEYKGNYNTMDPIEVKDLAYHNGSVWPWLIGAYVDVLYLYLLQNKKSIEEIKKRISYLLSPLVDFALRSPYHSLPELFSGDYLTPEGTRSQAWSVAEVYRILRSYIYD